MVYQPELLRVTDAVGCGRDSYSLCVPPEVPQALYCLPTLL